MATYKRNLNSIIEEMTGKDSDVDLDIRKDGKITISRIREHVVEKQTMEISLDLDKNFIQIYAGAFEPMIASGNVTAETSLIGYLFHLRGKTGERSFYANSNFFHSMNEYLKHIGAKEYSESHLRKALKHNISTELIVKMSRGQYMLNPLKFWDGSSKERMEEVIKLVNRGLINAPVVSKKENRRFIGQEDQNDGIIS